MTKARKKAAIILSLMSLVMTVPILMWTSYFHSLSGLDSLGQISSVSWMLSLIIALSYILYTFKFVPFVLLMQKEISLFKVLGIWVAIVSGIMEEIVFRKMLMDWSMSIGFNNFYQIIISGIVFGFAHASWVLIRGELKIAIPVILSTTILGCLLAALYIFAGRNLVPCILAHFIINLIIEPWLLLCAVSGDWVKDSKSIQPTPSTAD